MHRWRWLIHIVLKSLVYRQGRSLLLLGVLAMAASLVTSLGIVSSSMGLRVAEEVRKYGANLVILPAAARMEVGSGGLDFGTIAEPAYLLQEELLRVVGKDGVTEYSLHLRGHLKAGGQEMPAEGVDFTVIRRLYPWWQLQGEWPGAGEAVVGLDLAARLKMKATASVRSVVPERVSSEWPEWSVPVAKRTNFSLSLLQTCRRRLGLVPESARRVCWRRPAESRWHRELPGSRGFSPAAWYGRCVRLPGPARGC
jgi:hypothetical protein